MQISKIKTYLECFGMPIIPSKPFLPIIYYPGEGGWISLIQETFIPEGDVPYEGVLNLLNEQDFQTRFGKRRLRQDFKNIVNFWEEYGIIDFDMAIKFWDEPVKAYAAHRIPEWERMYTAIISEYDPLHNYDRTEDITETLTKTGTEQNEKSGKEASTRTGSVEDSKSGKEITTPSGTETITTQNNVNGYNSDTSVPSSDSQMDTTYTERKDELSFDQRKDTTTFNQLKDEVSFTNRKDTLSFTDRADTMERDAHIYGNIGVTTSQQMIESELKLRLYDLVTVIYKDIADQFLLSVY